MKLGVPCGLTHGLRLGISIKVVSLFDDDGDVFSGQGHAPRMGAEEISNHQSDVNLSTICFFVNTPGWFSG